MSSDAASTLAHARWKGTTKAERSEFGKQINEVRNPKLRQEIARNAARARWAKVKKAKKG